MLETNFLILITLIFLSAFFSGIETALMSLNMFKVNSLLKQGKKGSKALHRIKQDPKRLIITILIGNNLVNIGAASFATVVFTDMFGSSGIGIATGVMTFLILVFGEITPKTYATQNAERISLFVARPVELLSYVLLPFSKFFGAIAHVMGKVLGSSEEKQLSEEELKTIVTMGRDEGILSKEAADMMQNVLEFEGTRVVEVMTHKADVKMVNGSEKLSDVLDFVVKTPYSRYPVYLGSRDNIIGILDVDDVLRYTKNNKLGVNIKEATRPVYFVPESKEVDDLLTEFERKKIKVAVVVDEHGYVSGLVTIDDILEEIVGDIFDKSNRGSVYIKKASDGTLRVKASISVQELDKMLHLGLKGKHFNTLAGFIEHKLQRIPKRGEKIRMKRVAIIVNETTKQGIKSVKIVKS